jgi:hypothetical protein
MEAPVQADSLSHAFNSCISQLILHVTSETIALSQSPDSKYIVRFIVLLQLNQKPIIIQAASSASGVVNIYDSAEAMNSPSSVKPLKSVMNITTRVDTVRVARILFLNLKPFKSDDDDCFVLFFAVCSGSFIQPLQLVWHPSSELLSISSHSKKEAFRLVHAPSFSVFSNWPTAATPLHSVSSTAFSSNGMRQLFLYFERYSFF